MLRHDRARAALPLPRRDDGVVRDLLRSVEAKEVVEEVAHL
jgi:hypothetical protein